MRYRIVNWRTFQHYGTRCPPWIKLHSEILASRTWVMLDDRGRVLMIVAMLLASRDDASDGSFEGDPSYVRRVAYLAKDPDWQPLVEVGFIEPEAPPTPPKTETETEEEAEAERARGMASATPTHASEPLAGASKVLARRNGYINWTPEQFRAEVEAANADGTLTAAEVDEFCRYWSEPSPTGREKWKMQKTWSTKGRMLTAVRLVYGKQRVEAAPLKQGRIFQDEDVIQ